MESGDYQTLEALSDAIKALETGVGSSGSPSVSAVSITSATGINGSVLDVGDTVTVSVTFDEVVLVTGTPRIALDIDNGSGGLVSAQYATYSSGAGTDVLKFTYTIASGADTDGIGIPVNGLELNSGTIKDVAGNAASLAHSAVSDNSSYTVQIDATGPSAPSIYTIEGDNIINTAEKADGIFVAGTAEANATVSIAWGSDTRSVTADAGGNW